MGSKQRKFTKGQWVTYVPTGDIGEVVSVSADSFYGVVVRLVGGGTFNVFSYQLADLEPLDGVLPFEGE